jgi:hypothetical protein
MVGANASEFATQDYAERIGDTYLWEGTPAFAKRQQLLSPDQYEIVDVRTSRGVRRAMLFPKAILQTEFKADAPLLDPRARFVRVITVSSFIQTRLNHLT